MATIETDEGAKEQMNDQEWGEAGALKEWRNRPADCTFPAMDYQAAQDVFDEVVRMADAAIAEMEWENAEVMLMLRIVGEDQETPEMTAREYIADLRRRARALTVPC